MVWRQPGNMLLSEPMMVRLLMHMCITWPQWVYSGNSLLHVQYKGITWANADLLWTWLCRSNLQWNFQIYFYMDFIHTTVEASVCSTHWGRDKIFIISQTTFSNAFSWVKMYELCLIFHWGWLLRFQLTIFQHWFWLWLGADQVKSHFLNQWLLV